MEVEWWRSSLTAGKPRLCSPSQSHASTRQISLAVAAKPKHGAEEASRNALEALRALVGDDLVKVNALIVERMHSPVALIPQLAGHIVRSEEHTSELQSLMRTS